MNINKIAQLDDMYELTDELNYLKQIGYSGEYDSIYYDYIYKWARILKIVKLLNKSSETNILEIGGGLSPLQFIFSNHNRHRSIAKKSTAYGEDNYYLCSDEYSCIFLDLNYVRYDIN